MTKLNENSGFKGMPGPWQVKFHSTLLYVGPMENCGAQVHACMIDVSPAFKTDYLEKCGHNANLISAAPELLESLFKIVTHFETTDEVPRAEVLERAKAAINKALNISTPINHGHELLAIQN